MSYKTRTIKSNMFLENYSLTNLLNSTTGFMNCIENYIKVLH